MQAVLNIGGSSSDRPEQNATVSDGTPARAVFLDSFTRNKQPRNRRGGAVIRHAADRIRGLL